MTFSKHLKLYSSDADRCFRSNAFFGASNYMVFVGDHRTFRMYQRMLAFLDGRGSTGATDDGDLFTGQVGDAAWSDGRRNLRLEYYWSPAPDEGMATVLEKWAKRASDASSPDILVVGNGVRTAAANMSLEGAVEQLAYDIRNKVVPVSIGFF